MRFLVDECTGPGVASWLVDHGHDVFSVYDQARGMRDEQIIRKALIEDWILVSNDKDFGEMVYRDGRLHRGVILLRLGDERTEMKIRVLSRLLDLYADKIADCFLVATETQVRFAQR